jgi:hypothetical protein
VYNKRGHRFYQCRKKIRNKRRKLRPNKSIKKAEVVAALSTIAVDCNKQNVDFGANSHILMRMDWIEDGKYRR